MQITSQNKKDNLAIALTPSDLKSGALIKLSFIRPNKIFTADENIILRQVASVEAAVYEKVAQAIWELIQP